ncbi:MAG TPA: hypothetical protein VFN61_11865 [Acidimicrobiales bacterium]|nr:hypothetical protein [Acidimicrobiales bacterium]
MITVSRLASSVTARALDIVGWGLAIVGATLVVSAWSVAFPGTGLG